MGGPNWTVYPGPKNQPYPQDALTAGNATAQRKQFVAEHKILLKSYNDYFGVEEAGKELILYAVGDDALAPLKKTLHRFRRHDGARNDRTPSPQNGNQDDNSTEA